MASLHLPEPGTQPDGDKLGPSLCGRASVVVQQQIDGHDRACKVCTRMDRERRRERVDVRIDMGEALREVAHLIGGPDVEAYPPLVPETYQPMRCRQRLVPCFCDYCQIDRRNARIKADWEAGQQLRPHREYEHDFGSVSAALELLLRWRQDGAQVRSQAGGIEARGKELAKLGMQVQTTVRLDREDLTTRRATQAVDVERACRRAYAEEQERRGLTVDQCVGLLLSSVDSAGPTASESAEALGMTERSVKALISHGRRQVSVWLAATGYAPEPRVRSGLLGQVRRLRDEIGGEV